MLILRSCQILQLQLHISTIWEAPIHHHAMTWQEQFGNGALVRISGQQLPQCGKLNVIADKASRAFDDSKEWKLDAAVYVQLTSQFGTPEVDMFASRLNY